MRFVQRAGAAHQHGARSTVESIESPETRLDHPEKPLAVLLNEAAGLSAIERAHLLAKAFKSVRLQWEDLDAI